MLRCTCLEKRGNPNVADPEHLENQVHPGHAPEPEHLKASRQGVASRRFRTQKLENPNPYEYATAGCPEVCKFQCFKHVRVYINAIALHKDPSFQISCFGFALPLLSCFSLPFTAPREAVMQVAAL